MNWLSDIYVRPTKEIIISKDPVKICSERDKLFKEYRKQKFAKQREISESGKNKQVL